MTPRCFCSMGAIGPRRTGGEIFSKLNAGIVYPLAIELRHPWKPPDIVVERRALKTVPSFLNLQ